MCRWLAYTGPPVYLKTLVRDPEHSLIDQSLFSRLNYIPTLREDFPTNADGFGLGWYDEKKKVGLYREILLAYNDNNLLNLSAHIKSGLFLAHVRAASDRNVQRSNSHPFNYRKWLFQHNGEVPGFGKMRKQLLMEIEEPYFNNIQGNTDSEVCFHLALSYGLQDSPQSALEKMAGRIERARTEFGIKEPFTMSCCATDGKALYAVRYSSNNYSKTLFYARNLRNLREKNGIEKLPEGNIIICSEPLDFIKDDWSEVGESTILIVSDHHIETSAFSPQ